MALLSKAKMKEVLVLGHTGFIGNAVLRHLAGAGYGAQGASSKECDLLDGEKTKAFLGQLPDQSLVVFSSAIVPRVQDSFQAMVKNLQMAHHFASGVPPGRLAGVVYLSSVNVYGHQSSLPINEDSIPTPSSFYGTSKLAGECLLRQTGALDCPVTILRLPGVYGPGDSGHSVVGNLLNNILHKGRVTLTGNGSVRRDLVEIGDLCRVVERALEQPLNGLLNVATGKSLSIREVVDVLAAVADLSPAIDYASADAAAAQDLVFDVSALLARLPGLQFKSLAEGSAIYLAALRKDAPHVTAT